MVPRLDFPFSLAGATKMDVSLEFLLLIGAAGRDSNTSTLVAARAETLGGRGGGKTRVTPR